MRQLLCFVVCLVTIYHVVECDQKFGFNVGLNDVNDVVYDGVAQADWAKGNLMFNDSSPELAFRLSLNASSGHSDPFNYTLTVGGFPDAFRIDVTGASGIVGPIREKAVVLTFTCKKEDINSVSLVLAPDGGDPIQLYFKKQCIFPLLNVGLNDSYAHFVKDGVPTNYSAPLPIDQNNITVYIWLSMQSNIFKQPLQVKPDQIDYQVVDSFVPRFPTPDDSIARRPNLGSTPAEVVATIVCFSLVRVDTVATFDLGFFWDRAFTISVTKTCPSDARPGLLIGSTPGRNDIYDFNTGVAPLWQDVKDIGGMFYIQLFLTLNLNQTNSSIEQPYEFEKISATRTPYMILFVNDNGIVSTNDKDKFISLEYRCVQSGNGSSSFKLSVLPYHPITMKISKYCELPVINLGISSNNADVILSAANTSGILSIDSRNPAYIYAWLTNSITGIQQLRIKSISYDPSLIQVGASLLVSTISVSPQSFPALYFNFSCNTSNRVNITLELDIGWNGTSFPFNIIKDCSSPSPENKDEGSHKMNGGAIFALVLFILLAVFCFGGCGYNYVSKNKTGCDVIPGIDYYRQCYDKYCAPSSIGPQTDYTVVDDKTKGYGTYQTNL